MKWGWESLFFGSPFLHVFIVWLFAELADVLRVVKERLTKPKERLRGRLVTAQRIIFEGSKCVLAAGTRDEPQRTSAWEAKCVSMFTTNDHLQVLHTYIQTRAQRALEAPLSLAVSFVPSEFLTPGVHKKV